MKIFFIPIVCLFFLGCSNKQDTQQYGYDSNFHHFLDSLDKLHPSDVFILSDQDTPISIPLNFAVDQFDRVIVVDASDWSLNLLDIDGNLIFKTGSSGKGPGEYQSINQIEFFNESKLYIYDKKLDRLTFYSITGDSIIFENTVQLPSYSSYYLTSIHASTSNNYFGVFKKRGLSRDRNEQSNSFEVYELDENWQMTNKLFEMPGNEQLMIDNYPIDHELGLMSHWVVLNNKFHYARSNELKIHSIDLTDKKEQVTFDREIPEYKNNEKGRQFLMEIYAPGIKRFPGLEDQILGMETLPYFLKFTATNTYFYMSIFNPRIAETGKVLQINKKTGAAKVIEVPLSFVLFSATNERLYGIINNQDTANNIAIIEL